MVARTGGCGAFDYPAWPASVALVANAGSTPVRAHLGTMLISVTAAKSRGREGVAAARPHVSAPHLQRSAQYRDRRPTLTVQRPQHRRRQPEQRHAVQALPNRSRHAVLALQLPCARSPARGEFVCLRV